MAREAAEIQEDIARLTRVRTSGVRSTNVDGRSTTFQSDEEIANVINDLKIELAEVQGASTMAKPRIRGVNLGGHTY